MCNRLKKFFFEGFSPSLLMLYVRTRGISENEAFHTARQSQGCLWWWFKGFLRFWWIFRFAWRDVYFVLSVLLIPAARL